MYGYSVPNYVKDYEKEWKRYDRFLRVRRSLDDPGMLLVERKTRYWPFVVDYTFTYGTDKQVWYKDEYRMIYKFWPNEIKYVLPSLMASDIQAHGGAKALANTLDFRDDHIKEMKDRKDKDDFEMASSAAYDRLAWGEGRRISMAGRYNNA